MTPRHGVIGLLVSGFAAWSASVSHTVVVRDHLKASSSEATIQARMGDTTAGSWTGSLPGIDGLPTPTLDRTYPSTRNRRILQLTDTPPGWPGRVAVRLDFMNILGDFAHECSGILVGPKHALAAAHCVNWGTYERIDQGWVSDSFYVRPGFDKGHDYPSANGSGYMQPVRVLKSWVSRSIFDLSDLHGFGYPGDDDWALLELERDVGTELGWVAVGPLESGDENRYYHMLSYPSRALCITGEVCDTVSRSDSLSHSWGPIEWDPFQEVGGWSTFVGAWGGESGSALLDCEQPQCRTGKITVRATRWSTQGVSSLDSTMSGVVAKLLENVKVPLTGVQSHVIVASRGIEARWDGVSWLVQCDNATEIDAFAPDGSHLKVVRGGGTARVDPGRSKLVLVVARGPGWSRSRTLVVP